MRKIAFVLTGFLLLSVLFFGAAPTARAAGAEAFVRVRLSAVGGKKAVVALQGSYRCNGTAFDGGTVTLQKHGDCVRVSHDRLGTLSENPFVYIEHRSGDADTFFSLENRRYGRCRYRGDLYACLDGAGALCLVNYVSMAQYLCGVTGGELRNSHPTAALKAQAIAAKGFVLGCMGGSGAFDLTDGPDDQVYKGHRPEDYRVLSAVEEVAHLTLTRDGAPIKCYYCTSNGGQMLTPALRWGSGRSNDAYALRYDPYDTAASEQAAVLTVSQNADAWPDALSAFLLETAQRERSDVSAVLGLVSLIGSRDAENLAGTESSPAALAPQAWAAAELRVQYADGSVALLPCGFSPEALLRAGVVDCANADVWFVRPSESDEDFSLVFGRSIGHRVGMSHIGMLEMERQGFSFEEILAFYYPGASLTCDGVPASAARPQASPSPEPTPLGITVVEPVGD